MSTAALQLAAVNCVFVWASKEFLEILKHVAIDKWASLHKAAQAGDLETVQKLLTAAADTDVNQADMYGRTFLHAASSAGQHAAVQLLLAAGADPNKAGFDSRSPLCAAAHWGHSKVVQLLLAAGADVNVADANSYAPLHAAAARSHHGVVQLLLRKGANPQLQDALHQTAVYKATDNGHARVVQLLLDAWGKHQIGAVDLVAATRLAAGNFRMETPARLTKELRKLYPVELHQLCQGQHPKYTAYVLAAVLRTRALDASSIPRKQAKVSKRQDAVAAKELVLQHLVVSVAGMARSGQQGLAGRADCGGYEQLGSRQKSKQWQRLRQGLGQRLGTVCRRACNVLRLHGLARAASGLGSWSGLDPRGPHFVFIVAMLSY
jgi:hypothetical protein